MSFLSLEHLLTKESLVSSADMSIIKRECLATGTALAQGILTLGILDEDELQALLAARTHFQVVSKVLENDFKFERLEGLSINFFKQIDVLPLDLDDKTLTVGVVNPLDHALRRQIEFFFGYRVKQKIATLSQIRRGLGRFSASVAKEDTVFESFVKAHSPAVTRLFHKAPPLADMKAALSEQLASRHQFEGLDETPENSSQDGAMASTSESFNTQVNTDLNVVATPIESITKNPQVAVGGNTPAAAPIEPFDEPLDDSHLEEDSLSAKPAGAANDLNLDALATGGMGETDLDSLGSLDDLSLESDFPEDPLTPSENTNVEDLPSDDLSLNSLDSDLGDLGDLDGDLDNLSDLGKAAGNSIDSPTEAEQPMNALTDDALTDSLADLGSSPNTDLEGLSDNLEELSASAPESNPEDTIPTDSSIDSLGMDGLTTNLDSTSDLTSDLAQDLAQDLNVEPMIDNLQSDLEKDLDLGADLSADLANLDTFDSLGDESPKNEPAVSAPVDTRKPSNSTQISNVHLNRLYLKLSLVNSFKEACEVTREFLVTHELHPIPELTGSPAEARKKLEQIVKKSADGENPYGDLMQVILAKI